MPVSAEDIRRWILKEMARPAGEGADIFVEPVRLRGYSRIFKARLPGIANAVAIKLCLDPDDWQPSAVVAASQYAALSQAWQASDHSRKFLALEPYPLLLERGCVVMNWAGGRTMSDGWLWSGGSSAKMIEDAVAAG